MSEALLAAEGITVRFGGVVALDDVTLGVPPASIVGLVGPNGAGKTTMFGVLSGLIRPRAGSVHLAGTNVTRSSPQRRARLGLSRTFQRLELFKELTVREHLVVAHRVRQRRDRQFVRDLFGLGGRASPGEDDAVDGLLALLGLETVADRPVTLLPLGTGRLVEVARALASEPRVLLLDEPTSGLDPMGRRMVRDVIRVQRDRGATVFLNSHLLSEIAVTCDRVAFIKDGQVVASQNLKETAAASARRVTRRDRS